MIVNNLGMLFSISVLIFWGVLFDMTFSRLFNVAIKIYIALLANIMAFGAYMLLNLGMGIVNPSMQLVAAFIFYSIFRFLVYMHFVPKDKYVRLIFTLLISTALSLILTGALFKTISTGNNSIAQ